MPPVQKDEQFPQEFGCFTLQKRLGQGGFGVVYHALDRRFKAEVALKRISEQWKSNPDVAEQFNTSVAVSMKVNHPRVCRIFDHGEIDGIPYLTMPIYPGGSLRDKTVRDPWDAVALVHGLAWTMHEVHQQNVIHLDLKPENVLFTEDEQAIIVDFGCAIRRDLIDLAQLRDMRGIGTLNYMAPEQLPLDNELTAGVDIGRACDIWALGVILYELLTGRLPFAGETVLDYAIAVLNHQPESPSRSNRKVPAELDALCLRALAKKADQRFFNMEAFADALVKVFDVVGPAPTKTERPLVPLESIRFVFAGYGCTAPRLMPPDRLFLDVGGDLRAGVIDHHRFIGAKTCTASLILKHSGYVDQAVAPDRDGQELFAILVHQEPDLDCVASALFARQYLAMQRFPEEAEKLAAYVEWVDAGGQSSLTSFRSSLYVAYQILVHRLAKQRFPTLQERWDKQLRAGMALAEAVLREVIHRGHDVAEVDAFAVPGGVGEAARQEVEEDEQRYQRKLKDPRCHVRVGQLQLPDRNGYLAAVDLLLIRDADNLYDPDRCEMVKIWARADTVHSPGKKGFVALNTFTSEGPEQVRRCIISVRPDAPVTLEGLGKWIEKAEHERRKQGNLGKDGREYELLTGGRLPDRPGYSNPDPWYDGRAHDYTIIDSPRCGTVLTADEIEQLLLHFGNGTVAPLADFLPTTSADDSHQDVG
jgi:serine/threonine-protein kinase